MRQELNVQIGLLNKLYELTVLLVTKLMRMLERESLFSLIGNFLVDEIMYSHENKKLGDLL